MDSIIFYYNKNNQFQNIIKENNLEKVKKFYNDFKYSINLNQNIFDESLINNNLEICKFLYQNLNNKYINIKYSLINVSMNGNLEKFKWLISLNDDKYFDKYKCLKYSLQNNHTVLFKFIIDNYNIELKNNIELLKKACLNGNDEIVLLLLEGFENLNFSDENYIYFFNSCLSNNVELAKKIYKYSKGLDIITNKFDVLKECISLGKYEIVCWILDEIYENKNIENIDVLFELSCYSNNLNIVKKIYNLVNDEYINFKGLLFDLSLLNLNKIIYYIEGLSGLNLLNDNPKIIRNCIINNNIELLNYIITKYIKVDNSNKFSLEKIINDKFLFIIMDIDNKILTNLFKFIEHNGIILNIKEKNLYFLIENSNFENTKLFLKKFKKIEYDNNLLLLSAIYSNNLKKVKYIYEKILNKKLNNIDEIINKTLINGFLDIYLYFRLGNFIPTNINLILIKSIKDDNFKLFKHFGKIINRNNYEQYLNYSINFNKSNFTKFIIKKIKKIPKFNDNILEQVIINGDLNILNSFKNLGCKFQNIDPNLLLKFNNNINIELLSWFLSLNLNFSNVKNKFFNLLILNENYEQAMFFFNNVDNINLKYNNYESLKNICYCGNLFMINWFLKKINYINFVNLSDVFVKIIDGNNYELFKHFLNDIEIVYDFNLNYYFDRAFVKNYYEICNYILDLKKNNIDTILDIYNKFKEACISKDYKTIDLILKFQKQKNWMLYCIKYNFIHIAQYILNYKEDIKYNINSLLLESCLYSDLETIQWVYDNHNINMEFFNNDNFFKIFKTFNIDIIDWFYNKNKSIDLNREDGYLLKLSCTMNKYYIVEWLIEKKDVNIAVDDYICFKFSCYNQNLAILKLLYRFNDQINFNTDNDYLFKISSTNNDFGTFKWIYNRAESVDLIRFNYLYFKNAVLHDNINFLEFLIKKSNIESINFCNNFLIRSCLQYNRIDILKYLLDNYVIDIKFNSNFCIKYVVEDDNLDLLKLFYNYDNNIDLSINNEYLFITACLNNNIEMVKWLIEKKSDINISIYNDYTFFQVCNLNLIEIAEYFKSLKPDYFFFEIEKINENRSEIKKIKVNRILDIKCTKCFKKDDNCPICYEDNNNIVSNCSHQFCYDCLNTYYQKNYLFKCPICRNEDFKLFYNTK